MCKNYVYCEICQNYSHATQACFRYENFVKNNPVASSRVTSPVNNYERNIQGRPIEKPQYTSGRQNTAHFPRFQPPIVPGELPKTSYPTQREIRSNQDVRNDPQFNGGAAHHGQTKQKMGTKTQKYVKQPIDINEVHLEDNQRQQQEQQHWEEQILQLQREESLRKEKKENSTRIVQGVLKPKKENSAYEDRTAESKIAQIIRETDRPVFVNHYYAAAADTLPQVTRPTKTVYVVDGIEHSIHSAKVTQTTEKLTRDAAMQAAQDESIEHSIQLTQNLETAQRRLREAEKMQQIQGQNYRTYQAIQTYPVTQGPLVVELTGPNTSNASASSLPVLPNFSVPPPVPQTTTPTVPVVQPSAPPMPSHAMTPNAPSTITKSSRDVDILESIRDITKVLDGHIKLSAWNAEENTIQNATLLQQFIKSQDKRALDPALMAIPTFSGNDRTKCLDWISRVRNVCKQSGQNFRQELVNKSELLVQNFITSLHNKLTEAELIEKILRFFSDVPTTAHALEKLKQIQQGIDEPIVSYNQRYKNLVERVEGKPLEEITSIAAMEMYLGSINIHIRKAIRTTLLWNSKHAPRTVQEAMTKAQEIYIKHLYSTGEDRMDSQESTSTPIVIEETNTPGWPHKKQSEGIEHLIHSSKRTVTTRQSNQYGEEGRFSRGRAEGIEHSIHSPKTGTSQRWSTTATTPTALLESIRSSYTQILVNPMQLQEHKFTAWLERLVEARKNRQEKRSRPYRNYQQPYNKDKLSSENRWQKPQLRQKIKPVQEMDIQQIMDMYQCQYDDVIEAVDMYNLDVDECQSA